MSKHSTKRAGHIMFIIAWALGFALLILFFSMVGDVDGSYQYSVRHGTLNVDADSNGHYWVDGQIQGKTVRFMIDTGATYVAIPKHLAKEIGLRGRYPVLLNTAGGRIEGTLTRIVNMEFAGFSFNNVKAVIIPDTGRPTVLLGMNVLSKFSITQKNNQLLMKR